MYIYARNQLQKYSITISQQNYLNKQNFHKRKAHSV